MSLEDGLLSVTLNKHVPEHHARKDFSERAIMRVDSNVTLFIILEALNQ